MKKILLIIVTTFMSVAQVNASTLVSDPIEAGITVVSSSCSNNLFKYEFTNVVYNNGNFRVLDGNDLNTDSITYTTNNYFIELNQNTTYYFYTFLNTPSAKLYFFKEDFTLSSETSYIEVYKNKSFTIPTDSKYVLFSHYTKPSLAVTYTNKFMISEIEGLTEFIEYEECASNPDTGGEIIPDTTLDNFYSICINKLVELSNFTLENNFTLSAFGIVIFFTIIGLFIHLFKGGRK